MCTLNKPAILSRARNFTCGTIARGKGYPALVCFCRDAPYLHLFKQEARAMLELNLIYTQIKDMQGRLNALRGYL